MKNWIPLTHQERKLVWRTLYRDFKFSPSISRFPSFRVPSPFITYDISAYFEDSSLLHADEDLEEKALLAFQELIRADEYMLALDWQHECYWITPYGSFEKDEFGEWTVPVLQGMIDSFTRHHPILFHRKIREG